MCDKETVKRREAVTKSLEGHWWGLRSHQGLFLETGNILHLLEYEREGLTTPLHC